MSTLPHSFALHRDDSASGTDKYDHEISLVDRTRPKEEDAGLSSSVPPTDAEPDNETPLSPVSQSHSVTRAISKNSNAISVRRKGRGSEAPSAPQRPVSGVGEDPATESDRRDFIEPEFAKPSFPSKRDTFRTRRHKVRDSVKEVILGPRQQHVHSDAVSQFDILYENQRGLYILGVPRYSSNSLLNFDPPAWQTGTFHPSIVNITDAQVPDPSWVWADGWNNWYVDMRGDVDDEGWRYSFSFGYRFKFLASHWHGTHPFGYSFVRRRRWVRMRVKRAHAISKGDARTLRQGHMLDQDYFTIHNVKSPTSPDSSSIATSSKKQNAVTNNRWVRLLEDETEEGDILDIASLLARIRKATIDRQRLGLINNFLEHGGQETYYLAENVPAVVGLFVFQTSRRQLLDLLREKLKEAKTAEEMEGQKKQKQRASDSQTKGTDQVDNLQRAVEAADEECKRLGMSDVRDFGDITKDLGEYEGEVADSASSSGESSRAVGQTTIFATDGKAQEARETCKVDHPEHTNPQEESAVEKTPKHDLERGADNEPTDKNEFESEGGERNVDHQALNHQKEELHYERQKHETGTDVEAKNGDSSDPRGTPTLEEWGRDW